MVGEADVKDWYNKKHRSHGDGTWRPFEAYPIFLDRLNVETGKKMLDVGCGTGYLMKAANQRGLQTYGIDISEVGIKIAKQSAPNSHFEIGKGESLKYDDNMFDFIVCLGALEHFIDMEKGIQEMVRVGKKDARFCILVPNINFLFWMVKGSKGTEQQEINENLRSLDEWKSIFSKNGLEVLEVYQDQWRIKEIKIFSSINLLTILKKTLYKIAWLSLPLKYTYQFVFILEKKGQESD